MQHFFAILTQAGKAGKDATNVTQGRERCDKRHTWRGIGAGLDRNQIAYMTCLTQADKAKGGRGDSVRGGKTSSSRDPKGQQLLGSGVLFM